MYHHILVPVDGSELSLRSVDSAVGLARCLNAKITFLHVVLEGDDNDGYGSLLKAELVADSSGVSYASEVRSAEIPEKAIIAAVNELHCDLIIMASRGHHGIDRMLLGSVTGRVLALACVPVMVCYVEANYPNESARRVLATIEDEHRSIRVVLQALLRISNISSIMTNTPDLELVRLMVRFLTDFLPAYHHPKEEKHIFLKLRNRAPALGDLINELESQHEQDKELLSEITANFNAIKNGKSENWQPFGNSIKILADAMETHMILEDKKVFPAAITYLDTSDWDEIEHAFDANKSFFFSETSNNDPGRWFQEIADLLVRIKLAENLS